MSLQENVATCFREHNRMRSLLEQVHPHVCSLLCPSVKRVGEEWTHVQLCREIGEMLNAQGKRVSNDD